MPRSTTQKVGQLLTLKMEKQFSILTALHWLISKTIQFIRLMENISVVLLMVSFGTTMEMLRSSRMGQVEGRFGR